MLGVGQRIRRLLRSVPRKFQVTGVRFLENALDVEREKGALLADDMGLGKSFQFISYLALHPERRPAIIVPPASLKLNWKREFWKHAKIHVSVLDGFKTYGLKIRIWRKQKGEGASRKTERWFSNSAARRKWITKHWHRIRVRGKMKRSFPKIEHDVIVLNYDILEDWIEELLRISGGKIQIFCMDECQKVKSKGAKRTKLCKQMARKSRRVVALSGTPITNRPVEFFSILNMIRPKEFDSFTDYAFSYCNPKRGWMGRGWDYSGASNLKELNERLQGIMLRRMKEDVLTELPPLTRTVLPIQIDMKEYNRACKDFINWLREKSGKDAVKRARKAEALVRLGHIRSIAAMGKVPVEKEWIRDYTEGLVDRKLVVFASHYNVLDSFAETFDRAMFITGKTPMKKRDRYVQEFQHSKRRRLLFGNLDALGEGHTLTAAAATATTEFDWVPTKHDQAEDRINRIGQTARKINSYYFLAHGTIEERIMQDVEDKRRVVGQILDGEEIPRTATKIIDSFLKG